MSEPVPPEKMRASDADRERVVEGLRHAHGEGRITLAEFDERVQEVWAARTYGELAEVTADLPLTRPAVLPSDLSPVDVRPRRPRNGRRIAMRISAGTWFVVSLINVLIWGVICLVSWHLVYPWWVWVAGPWGAVILAGQLAEFARNRHRG